VPTVISVRYEGKKKFFSIQRTPGVDALECTVREMKLDTNGYGKNICQKNIGKKGRGVGGQKKKEHELRLDEKRI